jgi:lipopolysaccharide export LptBFGC system permease protein LptF
MADKLSGLKNQLLNLLEEEEVNTNKYVEMLTPASDATEEEIEEQREKIAAVYSHRKNLYDLIQETIDVQKVTSKLVDDTYKDTRDVNEELNQFLTTKDEIIKRIGQDTETKQQLIAFNMNYGKQYNSYRYIFIALVIIMVCLLAVSLLAYTPIAFLTRPLTIAIYIIGGAYVINLLIHLLMKSNLNHDEYNWLLSPNNKNNSKGVLPTLTGSLGVKTGLKSLAACVGEYCCDEGQGTVWSEESQTCVANSE